MSEDVFDPSSPWDDLVGFTIDRLEPGICVAHAELGEPHQQAYGIVHGGVWASLVESAASVAAAVTAGTQVVGVSNSTDFLRSHRDGRVDVVAEPVHTGRRQALWEVRITRASDGKLVARGQVRFQVMDEAVR